MPTVYNPFTGDLEIVPKSASGTAPTPLPAIHLTTDDGQVATEPNNNIRFAGLTGTATTSSGNQISVRVVDPVPLYFKGDDNISNQASGQTLKLLGDTASGVTTSGTSNGVKFQVGNASTTQKGVASFTPSQFSVSGGQVSANLATSSAAGISSYNPAQFTVSNGQVSANLTTSSNPGISNFDQTAFAVSSGTVSLNTVSAAKGGTGISSPAVGSALFGNGSSPMTASTLQSGQIFIGSSNQAPQAAYISADYTMSVTPSAGAIQLSCNMPGMLWANYTGPTATLANGRGLCYKGASLCTVTLIYDGNFNVPESRFLGMGSALWQVVLGSGQKLYFGNQVATTSVAANSPRCCLHFYAIDSNNWQVISSIGNFTIT